MKNSPNRLKIADVKPWYVRAIILILFGLPAFTKWPLSLMLTNENSIENIFIWLGYGCFIWLIILLNVGLKQLVNYLSLAFWLALFTSIIGAMFRRLPGLLIEQSSSDIEDISFKMLYLLLIMISVIPYILFSINCFSVSSYISRIAYNDSKFFKVKIHIALFLRVSQHVGEVALSLLTIWKEENPTMIKPRFRGDWSENKFSILSWLRWLGSSALTWCFALLVYTFEAIPYLSSEMRTILNLKNIQNNGKS